MTRRVKRGRVVMAGATLVAAMCAGGFAACATRPVVAPISDAEFWKLSTDLSEQTNSGFTHSENLVSNEAEFVHTIRLLRPSGGAFFGVGPEQNFSYIARLRPTIAFIVDIRRQNRNLHLMYKALFEASSDRAEFLSRLFSRERPPGLGAGTAVDELFARYAVARPQPAQRDATAEMIRSRLVDRHRFVLLPEDVEWIQATIGAFYERGFEISYGRASPDGSPPPSYRSLMTATDVGGRPRSFLASEDDFAFVKQLHERNAIVPIVGDFAGRSALRRAGDVLRARGEAVSAFYESNVEVYLNKEQSAAFCENLAALPRDPGAWIIHNKGMRPLSAKLRACLATSAPARPSGAGR